jgi:hypothetical protein
MYAPMHDAVTNGNDAISPERFSPAPVEEELDRALMIEPEAGVPFPFADHALGAARDETRSGGQPVQLAAQQ